VVEIKSEDKHFMIELYERIEKNWLEHEGNHKITIEGITVEGANKITHLEGELKLDVKKRPKK